MALRCPRAVASLAAVARLAECRQSLRSLRGAGVPHSVATLVGWAGMSALRLCAPSATHDVCALQRPPLTQPTVGGLCLERAFSWEEHASCRCVAHASLYTLLVHSCAAHSYRTSAPRASALLAHLSVWLQVSGQATAGLRRHADVICCSHARVCRASTVRVAARVVCRKSPIPATSLVRHRLLVSRGHIARSLAFFRGGQVMPISCSHADMCRVLCSVHSGVCGG